MNPNYTPVLQIIYRSLQTGAYHPSPIQVVLDAEEPILEWRNCRIQGDALATVLNSNNT